MKWYERLMYAVLFLTGFFVWPVIVYAQAGIIMRGNATWYGNVGCVFWVLMSLFMVYGAAVMLHDNKPQS